jgi:hypothetical protein
LCNNDDDDDDTTQPIVFRPQQDEIANIQWMTVQEFCDQPPWQKSPLFTTLNLCILKVSQTAVASANAIEQNLGNISVEAKKRHHRWWPPMIEHQQLDVGFAPEGKTNALFLPPSIKDSSRL